MGQLLAVAVIALATACGGSATTSTSPAASSVAGTYTLKTVNGSALPFTTRRFNPPDSYMLTSKWVRKKG